MCKVILISLYDTASMGPRILHKVLENKGHEVHSIFFKSGNLKNVEPQEVRLLLDKIKEIGPQLIGISLRSRYFKTAVMLTEAIKKESKERDVKIIWGGIHPTVRPEKCLEHADMICIGEGEEAMGILASRLDRKERIDNIKSIWTKEKKNKKRNKIGALRPNLDEIPFPDFTDLNKYYIDDCKVSGENIFPDHKAVYTIMTTRNCPFSCSFCSGSVLKEIYKGCGQFLRRRSVENVITELMEARKRWPSIQKVYFVDDIFSYDIEWLKKFSPLYKKNIGLPFYCYVHPLYVNDETIAVMKDMGLYEVNIGIQSGSERVRKEIYNRYESNEQIINAIRILNEHKVRALCDLILGNPYETEADKQDNLELLMKLKKPIILFTYNLLFFPNKLTEMALGDGLIEEKDLEENRGVDYRWDDKFSQDFSDSDKIWNSLYYLASKGYPEWMIKKCRYMNPSSLVFMVKCIEKTSLVVSSVPKAIRYVKKGEFKMLGAKIKRNLRLNV